MHTGNKLLAQMRTIFAHHPTPDQAQAMTMLCDYISSNQPQRAFILRGYAGTGKTTLVAALVQLLRQYHKKPILLAPTGRAAKVFGLYAHTQAYTIHRVIYRQRVFEGENTTFEIAPNKLKNTLFVVDEASMLANMGGGDSLFGTGYLLDDLITHVYSGQGCSLLLVGDTAQLPPVGECDSPALQADTLSVYGLHTMTYTLTEVVRQSMDSGVLWNATQLRLRLPQHDGTLPTIRLAGFTDIERVVGSDLLEILENSYRRYGTDETIVITRSNKRANIYNNGIRARLFDREEALARGDLVMIAKNNYYWPETVAQKLAPKDKPTFDYLANGDIAEICDIRHQEELYGFTFANVCLRLVDYDNYEIQVKVILDTLQAEAPALSRAQSEMLYQQVLMDYMDIKNRRQRLKKVRENPYYNAVQIKFAYALTCHKAQGGQWQSVFVDQGYLSPEHINASYLRWLYTAMTRTQQHLYLVNWPQELLQQHTE